MHFSSRLKGLTKPKKVVKTYAKTLKKGIKTKKKRHTLKFLQVNCHKRALCNDYVYDRTKNIDSYIVLGQEPNCLTNKITTLDDTKNLIKGISKFKSSEVKTWPRSFIYTNNMERSHTIEHLSDQDITTLLIDSKIAGVGKILSCSVYCDRDKQGLPDKLHEAADMAKKEGYIFLAGGDFNARNRLYGSNRTCPRGRLVEQFMQDKNLDVCNIGNEPTYISGKNQSTIDITLVSAEYSHLIRNWTCLLYTSPSPRD